jgi:hypothetical protein
MGRGTLGPPKGQCEVRKHSKGETLCWCCIPSVCAFGDCKCNSVCICIIKVSVVLLLLLLLLLPLQSQKSETIVVLDVCSGSVLVLAIYESTIKLKCSVFIENSICNITPISRLPWVVVCLIKATSIKFNAILIHTHIIWFLSRKGDIIGQLGNYISQQSIEKVKSPKVVPWQIKLKGVYGSLTMTADEHMFTEWRAMHRLTKWHTMRQDLIWGDNVCVWQWHTSSVFLCFKQG